MFKGVVRIAYHDFVLTEGLPYIREGTVKRWEKTKGL